MAHILTEADFDLFKAEAARMLDAFGLKDWNIAYFFDDLTDGNLAQCHVNRPARRCKLVLSRIWEGEEPTEATVKDSARHEVLELLLDDLEHIFWIDALNEDDKHREIARARHAIIHRILHACY